MKCKIKNLFLASILILSAGMSYAQSKKIELSLDKAIEIALDSNPVIKTADLEIERQEYVIRETKANLIPSANGTMSYGHNIKLPVIFLPSGAFGSGGAIEVGLKNSFSALANATIPIYMPTIYRNISLTREQLALTIEQARASKIDMKKQVKDAYYNILLSENSLNVLMANKKSIEEVVNDTEEKYKQGVASEYDLLTAQVQLQNLEPVIIRAKSSLEVANYMLKVLLSFPEDVEVKLVDSFDHLQDKANNPNIESTNLSTNTDLKQLDYQIKMLEHNFRLSRANRLPTISGYINYNITAQANDFNFKNYNWPKSSATGLQINVPIFSGMKNRYKDIQIKNSIQQAAINRDYLEANLMTQASSIISNIKSAKAQIISNELAIEQAKKAYDISNKRYNLGMGTILEVNSAQVALMQAELNINQAIFDLLSALSEYEKLIGNYSDEKQ